MSTPAELPAIHSSRRAPTLSNSCGSQYCSLLASCTSPQKASRFNEAPLGHFFAAWGCRKSADNLPCSVRERDRKPSARHECCVTSFSSWRPRRKEGNSLFCKNAKLPRLIAGEYRELCQQRNRHRRVGHWQNRGLRGTKWMFDSYSMQGKDAPNE